VTEEIKSPPEDFTELIDDWSRRMTNFDHSIAPGLEGMLRSGKVYCHHAALDFNGDVWFEDGLFHERVNVYHKAVAHYEAPTLRELMVMVNDEHGWE
jgi:hypothetical protein